MDREMAVETTVRTTIIDEAHQKLGHVGTAKTQLKLAPAYVWSKYVQRQNAIRTDMPCMPSQQMANNKVRWQGARLTNS
jgi:hypothetical protein